MTYLEKSKRKIKQSHSRGRDGKRKERPRRWSVSPANWRFNAVSADWQCGAMRTASWRK